MINGEAIEERVHAIHFCSYLQMAFWEYPDISSGLKEGRLPDKKRLIQMNVDMFGYRDGFNCYYFEKMFDKNEEKLLETEHKAWKLLSPKIESHLNEFMPYVEDYNQESADCQELLGFVQRGYDLVLKWNKIANSYRCKYSIVTPESLRLKTKRKDAEQLVKDLIKELSGESDENV